MCFEVFFFKADILAFDEYKFIMSANYIIVVLLEIWGLVEQSVFGNLHYKKISYRILNFIATMTEKVFQLLKIHIQASRSKN